MADEDLAGTKQPQAKERRGNGNGAVHELRLPPGPQVLSRELIDAHQRDRILNAMLVTAATYGYEGCSVHRVSKRAGVSTATFYQLFSNREDAFLRMYDRAAGALLDRTLAAWDAPGEAGTARLRRCLSTLLKTIAANPELARVGLVEVTALGPSLFEHRERHLRRFAAPLERAMHEHNGTAPPPLALRGIVATSYDLIHEHVANGRTNRLVDELDDLYDFSLTLFQYASAPGPPAGTPEPVSAGTLARYQQSLDRVYVESHELMAQAPSWQAALYSSLRACYTEMSSHPESLHLHFVATAHDENVKRVRTGHRARLLALLHEQREDAPPEPEVGELLTKIHEWMSGQVLNHEVPPDLDAAEHTFATMLFNHGDPEASRQEPAPAHRERL